MQKTMSNGSKIMRNVNASMLVEGFNLSASTKDACVEVASGKRTAAQLIKARLTEFSSKRK